MKRRLGTAILMVAMTLLAACESITLPLPCDLMIVALPADSTLQPGDPLPAEPHQIIAGPGDFDVLRSSIRQTLPAGDVSLDLQLRGAAIGRVAGHTKAHLGEPMALLINGEVVAVPIIQSSIPDGAISVTPDTADADAFVQRFRGCVR